MSIKFRERLTYANVASTLALLLVVGGGGVAVASGAVQRDSVGSPQIRNGSVKSVDIKNSTIKSSDIKNRTVKSSDIRNNHLRSVDVKDDSLTGVDIDESTLGQVPDAAHADAADTATSANTVADGSITAPKFDPGRVGVVRGYAWMNLPTSDGALTTGYVYNSSGGNVMSNHLGTGIYSVTFEGLNIGYGHVQVTSYGGGSVTCKVTSWTFSTAHVRCYDAAGTLANSSFNIAMIE